MENLFKIRFAQVLREKNIKPADLSRMTGIPKSTLSNYLSGRMVPKTERIFLLADALHVQGAWLIGHEVSQKIPADRDELTSEIDKMFALLSPEQKDRVIQYIQKMINNSSPD